MGFELGFYLDPMGFDLDSICAPWDSFWILLGSYGVRFEFEPLDFRTTPQVIEHEIQSMLDESIPMFSSKMRRERRSMA